MQRWYRSVGSSVSKRSSVRLISQLFLRGSSSYSYKTHSCGELGISHVGQQVTLCGWTKKKRMNDPSNMVFLPLGDASGKVQLTVKIPLWKQTMEGIRSESVVLVEGVVQERPEKDKKEATGPGSIEVEAKDIQVLGKASNLVFLPSTKGLTVTEEVRLRDRHLDLRTSFMQRNIRLRSNVAMAMREFLVHQHDFVEVDTPTLFRRTSEGAREFIVPSRKSKFYSLVQSPQQFKQMLMAGGFDRYFQFAHCYRDEDLRSDRQPEFTQLDLEMSFVRSDGIMSLMEDLLSSTIPRLCPELQMTPTPFPRMPYSEAMAKYGSDKPDTREDKSNSSKLSFLWVTDFPLFQRNEHTNRLESSHHPFTAPVPEHEELLRGGSMADIEMVKGQHYDLVVNGVELGGGSIRIHDGSLQEQVLRSILEVPTDEFSHLLKALRSGCPPHGGIALGFDRLMALLCQVSNLRDVLAFPKSHTGKDLLTGAPTSIKEDVLLQEYNLKSV